jgi:hypothetical protein
MIMILLMIFPDGRASNQDQEPFRQAQGLEALEEHDQDHEQEMSAGVLIRPKKVERHVPLVPHHPAVVAGPNVKEIARLHFIVTPIIHLARGATRNDQANVLHHAGRGARGETDMLRPFPTGLVTGPANRHRADFHDFEITLFERPHLVRLFETLD